MQTAKENLGNPETSAIRLEERFVRWQENLRHGLGGHVALIVALASAALGFIGSLLNGEKAHFGGSTTWCILAASLLFLLSLLVAVFISCNRLWDVRGTLGIIKKRRQKSPKDLIQDLQNQTDNLSHRTWCALNWQLGLFTAASLFLTAGTFLAFKYRLF